MLGDPKRKAKDQKQKAKDERSKTKNKRSKTKSERKNLAAILGFHTISAVHKLSSLKEFIIFA